MTLYYKCVIAIALALVRVVNYTPTVMLQIEVSLTIVIYNRNLFIEEATSFMTSLKKGGEEEEEVFFLAR